MAPPVGRWMARLPEPVRLMRGLERACAPEAPVSELRQSGTFDRFSPSSWAYTLMQSMEAPKFPRGFAQGKRSAADI